MTGWWHRLLPADRRWVLLSGVLTVLVLAVAVAATVVAVRAGSDDDAERTAAGTAAAHAVTELMTFGPDDDAARRAQVRELLTGALAADYAGRGPDVVFSGAVESKVSMSARVLDVAVGRLDENRARVLVFVDQSVSVAGDPATDRLPVSRWATLQRSGGHWRLARLEPVSG